VSMPWYKHNVGDYAKDVRGMTYEQQGLYVALRDISWDQAPPGTLPNDDTELARLLSLPEKRWIGHRPVVLALWKGPGKRLTHTALHRQGEHAFQKSESAKKGPTARETRKRSMIERSSNDHLSEIRDPKSEDEEKKREESAELRSSEVPPSLRDGGQDQEGTVPPMQPNQASTSPSNNRDGTASTPEKERVSGRLRRTIYSSDPRFEKFWVLYPNRTLKGEAEKAWNKLKPTDELVTEILAKVAEASRTDKWTKDSGMYIPNPAKWLGGRGWLDDFTPIKKVRKLVL
jgi:uncharacterized protein YdaU (DUF1376 family)